MFNSATNTNSFGHQHQRVNELRKNLEKTVKEFSEYVSFQKEEQQKDAYDYQFDDDDSVNSVIAAVNNKTAAFEKDNRPLYLVYQSAAAAFIQIFVCFDYFNIF